MRARLLFANLLIAGLISTPALAAAQNTAPAAGSSASGTAAGAGVVPDADAAKAFLTSVYKHYGAGGIGVDSVGPDAPRYFHASLVALLRADQKAASPDVGAIDADPVCACQDWNGIWNLVIDVKIETPDRAMAKVSFYLADPKDDPKDSARKLAITLAAENGGWRIYDISDQTDPTAPFALRKALKDDIASHTHPK